MTAGAAIEAQGLEHAWARGGARSFALDELRVARGESVFLRGASGSGKSTLLGVLAGVHVATGGTLRVLGEELATLKPSARDRFRGQHLGYIFQQFNLVPYLAAVENVLLPCRFSPERLARAGGTFEAARAEATRLLATMGIAGDLLDRRPWALSIGQQQRVAAARALIGSPELILADEPTSALDADSQAAFLELLRAQCAKSGAALVFASHDARLASLFDRVLELPARAAP